MGVLLTVVQHDVIDVDADRPMLIRLPHHASTNYRAEAREVLVHVTIATVRARAARRLRGRHTHVGINVTDAT